MNGNVAIKLSKYEEGIQLELEDLFLFGQQSQELKYVLTREWTDRIKVVVETWGPKKKFTDGGYNFYRILSQLHNTLSPAELERRLCIIANAAKYQGRLRPYRKTRSELCSSQNNQILASIFEITILSRMIENFPNTKVFPKIGQTEQDVEALIKLDDRSIYVEAKAIGYSEYDPKGRVGSQSIDSMKRQVRDALSYKLEDNRQLELLAAEHPTALFIALGFHADAVSASWAVEDFLDDSGKDVALIAVFGSAFCRKIALYRNEKSPHPISHDEAARLVVLASHGKEEGV